MIRYITTFILFFTATSIFAQKQLKELGWRSPVGIPIFLSGNFAELRTGHFHGGIDIKTQGKEGFNLYAVQDGYVSRIKVTPGGYGKAIYITHPDGYTSVYAHLSEYNIQLDKYVKAEQYEQQSYAVNLFPEKGELPVKKGDIIGLSGNSGSSAGPHLHFEVRETATQKPMNGLFLGYEIEDTIQPKFYYLYAFPQGNYSKVNYSDKKKVFSLNKRQGKYYLKNTDTLLVNGSVGFGLKVNEYLNDSHNRCGVYQLNMYVDNELYMQQEYDEFSFAETRYINSLMDYEENVNLKRKLYNLYKHPNNNLSIFKKAENRGVVSGFKDEVKKIRIEAIDAHKNISELTFWVKFEGTGKNEIDKDLITIPWQDAYVLDTVGFKVDFPAKIFYDTLFMSFSIDTNRKAEMYSSVFKLHKKTTPVHRYFKIEVPCDSVDSLYYDKLILAQYDKDEFSAVGGLYANGVMKAKVRNLGNYVVTIDTVKPSVIPLNGLDDKLEITVPEKIQFKIDDDFAGVKDYKGTINGNWVLFEWDPKNKLITYNVDEYFPLEGFCELEVSVMDGRGNETIYLKEFEIISESDHDIGQ